MPNAQIVYNPLPSQRTFHNDLETDVLIFAGGLGSGKSYALVQKLLHLSYINKGFAGGVLCPTVADFKRDILPLFEQTFAENGLQDVCRYKRGDTCFIFPWTDKPLYVFTGERPIAGPNLAYCGINEPSLIKEIRVNEMMRRVREKSAPVKQRAMAGTLEDHLGWLQDFIEQHEKSGKLRLVNASTAQNVHLDPEYYQHLKDTLDPLSFRLFAEGEMIRLGSNVFYYSFSQDNNLCKTEYDPNLQLFVNVDFNVGNMTAVCCQQYWDNKGNKITHFVDEICLKSDSADTFAMAEAIKARYPKSLDWLMITCDASGKARKTTGPSDAQVLKQIFGEDAVRYKSAGNMRLRKRQILINGLFSHNRILINKEKCPTLVRDVSKVQQRIDDFTKDKKNPELTHASDAMDYYCTFEYELLNRNNFSTGTFR